MTIFPLSRLLPCALTASAISCFALLAQAQTVTGDAVPRVEVQGSNAGTLQNGLSPSPSIETVVLDQSILSEPGLQRLSRVLERDASVGESYAITGYYQNFSLHGFILDLGSDYRINNFVVPGEMDIAMENKEAIVMTKGVTGAASGTTSPYGAMNFLSKTPENVGSATLQVNGQGGSELTLDAGAAASNAVSLGWRLNAALEALRPVAPDANGHRDFVSLALEMHPLHGLHLSADLEWQNKSQPAIPGFQLLGGRVFPIENDESININQQAWSRPVKNDSEFAGLRALYALDDGKKLSVGAASGVARINDNLAFPDGCATPPYQYFCSNGQYEIFDYHADERRSTRQVDGSFSWTLHLGSVDSNLVLSAEQISRSVVQRNLYSAPSLFADGTPAQGDLANVAAPLPAPEVDMGFSTYAAEIEKSVSLYEQLGGDVWHAQLGLRRARIEQFPGTVTDKLLPQLSLQYEFNSVLSAHVAHATALSFGSTAPIAAENSGALLAPRLVRETEFGVHWVPVPKSVVSATLFRIERPFEFTEPFGNSFASLGNYVQQGRDLHRGIDLAAESSARHWRLSANLALLDATASGSGYAAFDGVQEQNTPREQGVIWAHYLPGDGNADLAMGLIGAGKRGAVADGSVTAPGYARIDSVASWNVAAGGGGNMRFAISISNLTDRHYWRDVGFAYGADLLFPAPRRTLTAALTVSRF